MAVRAMTGRTALAGFVGISRALVVTGLEIERSARVVQAGLESFGLEARKEGLDALLGV